jgi:hypothetical protein
MTTPRYRFSASRVQRGVRRMDVSFSTDDRQEYLDLLSQSVSKHALDFLVSDESSRSLSWSCLARRDRSRARSEKRMEDIRGWSISVKGWRGPLWRERFHSCSMDERKGLGSLMKSSSRSLFSPSTIFGQIRLTRRSVQSCLVWLCRAGILVIY